MIAFENLLIQLNTAVSLLVLSCLLVMGLYLSIRLKCMPWRKTKFAFLMLWQEQATMQKEFINPFQGLMIALSAAISTSAVTGVAVAIALGGPGAVFWMWLVALLSMATQYAETVLAVEYRESLADGDYHGGVMYTIKNGLERKWLGWASFFALCGAIAAFGVGNLIPVHTIATAVANGFKIPPWQVGIIITCVTSVFILTGMTRFVNFTAYLIPVLVCVYLSLASWVIFHHLSQLPTAFALIIKSAFTPVAAISGFTGSTVWLAVRAGMEQGMVANDAGWGRGTIAHAAVKTLSPVRQGLIAMLGTVINVLLLGTVTALVILVTGSWHSGNSGLELSALGFTNQFHQNGSMIVILSLSLFGFVSVLSWSFYGERCVTFLGGEKWLWPYRLLWLAAIPVAATHKITVLWLLTTLLNSLMVIPNLLAILLLAPVLFRLTSNYLRIEDSV
jgi:AGCS family alanine or glycine:cation symporter